MSLLKYVDRLKHMDDLIRRQATGTPDEFAEKLGIGRTVLMENIREMKDLGAKITYCHYRKSYHYETEFCFVIGKYSNKILGGGILDIMMPSHLSSKLY